MVQVERDALEPCTIHELPDCALCRPPAKAYRRGARTLDVPAGSFVEVRGGKGVYHHPDCHNVTGDWEGSEQATLGQLVVHSPAELRDKDLRPAHCCQPPSWL